MITRRKRSILEMAVATACFGAAAVAAAMPLTAVAAPQNANAQASAPKKAGKKVANEQLLPIVVVNGFISSLNNSIAIQKNADSIVEAVSAQDIGKLPATSIGSALSHLPGMSMQMVGGQPQALNIHGFGQDFIGGLMDGVEQVTTATDRGVHFNQYPPGWFRDIKVYLSPQANLIGQELGGTVDMQTWRPLDVHGRKASINAQYYWVSPGDLMPGPGVNDKGYGINGIYINQYDDRRFGVALGVDLDANPTKRLREAPWGYPTIAPGNPGAGAFVIGGSKNYNYSSLRKRDAYFATFQYRPSSAYTSTLDLFYEDYHKTSQRKGMELPLAWGSNEPLSNLGTINNGWLESGTFSNVYPVIRNGYTHHKDRVYDIHWGNEFKFSDDWTAGLDASYNSAMRDYAKLENYSGLGYDGPGSNGAFPGATVNFSYAPDGQLLLSTPTSFTGSNIVLTDPQGWGSGNSLVQQGFLNVQHNEEYLANLKLTAQHYFESGPISSMEIGADYAHHHKNNNIFQYFVMLPGSCTTYSGAVFSGACSAPIPASALQGTYDPLSFMGLGPELLYDPNSLLASGVDALFPTVDSSLTQSPLWTLHEDDTYGFLQFNIQTNLGQDVGLRGNFGVQVAHTSQKSDGERLAPGSSPGGLSKVVLLPMSGGTSFTRYLPSLNLVFSFPHNYDARLGIARTMARPRMSQMSAGMSIGTNLQNLTGRPQSPTGTPEPPSVNNLGQVYFSGQGGNPALLPTMSTNYNIRLDHYFGASGGYHCTANEQQGSSLCAAGATGYVSLSGYYYQLSDYINDTASTVYNFAPFVNAYLGGSPAEQAALGTTYGLMTIPVNDGSGHVYGAQLETNLPLGDLTHWLDGFGVEASGALTKSAVYYPGNPMPELVEGLSKWVEHYTLYYAYGGFQAEAELDSWTSFQGRIFAISESRQLSMFRGQHWISAQVSYQFSQGPLKGLTLIAAGQNLGNEIQEVYNPGDPRQIIRWERYGRSFQVGFSYNFQ